MTDFTRTPQSYLYTPDYHDCGQSPSCSCASIATRPPCSSIPKVYKFTMGGVSSHPTQCTVSPKCEVYNGTHYLTWCGVWDPFKTRCNYPSSPACDCGTGCHWYDRCCFNPFVCGFTSRHLYFLNLNPVSATQVNADLFGVAGPSIRYRKIDFKCLESNVMTLFSSISACQGWPPTITLEPAFGA